MWFCALLFVLIPIFVVSFSNCTVFSKQISISAVLYFWAFAKKRGIENDTIFISSTVWRYLEHQCMLYSTFVISFFNWSAQQINNDNNCIFLLSSCQNQIEIDRSISQSQKWPFITRRFVLEITAKCVVITHLMSLVVCTQLQHWSWGTAPESGDI